MCSQNLNVFDLIQSSGVYTEIIISSFNIIQISLKQPDHSNKHIDNNFFINKINKDLCENAQIKFKMIKLEQKFPILILCDSAN